MFFPYFSGIGTLLETGAKASLIGMTRDTSKRHIARAVLEGIALSIDDLYESLKIDADIDIREIKVDGGAVANNLLCQINLHFQK